MQKHSVIRDQHYTRKPHIYKEDNQWVFKLHVCCAFGPTIAAARYMWRAWFMSTHSASISTANEVLFAAESGKKAIVTKEITCASHS